VADFIARRDDRSAPFFDGAADGRLMIQRCRCGTYLGPERRSCPACADPSLEWVKASGSARLVSWIVTHARSEDPARGAATRVIGLVELEEGPWMYAALLDTDPESLREDVALRVDFPQPVGGETIPAFRTS
jgi:uncharacterized protein